MQTHAKRYTSHHGLPVAPDRSLRPTKVSESARRNSFLHSKESASLQCSVAFTRSKAIQLIAKNGLRNKAVFLLPGRKARAPFVVIDYIQANLTLTRCDMTQLSISDAAKRVGVTRQTIYKKVSNGELSATTDRRGNKQIDVSELLRVYGNLSSNDIQAETTLHKQRHVKTSSDTSVLQLELERAKMQIQLRDRELQIAQERIDELKSREVESKARERDALEKQQQLMTIIDRQTLLLAAPKAAKPAPRPKAAPVTKPKPQAKAKATPKAAKPVQARKSPAATAKPEARAKPLAKVTTRTKAAPAKVVKKATRK